MGAAEVEGGFPPCFFFWGGVGLHDLFQGIAGIVLSGLVLWMVAESIGASWAG